MHVWATEWWSGVQDHVLDAEHTLRDITSHPPLLHPGVDGLMGTCRAVERSTYHGRQKGRV